MSRVYDESFIVNGMVDDASFTSFLTVFQPGLEDIKLFSCSTQLSMEFFLLINVKMPTIVGILTFMNGKNSILCVSEPVKSRIS